ncbi:MAG TPA: exosortase/archaeosortase family protein [Fimbriimonadaceae bacterium]|nr:exosortase/archaeosortase family protein [Fimbriimonadaceae bacterium]
MSVIEPTGGALAVPERKLSPLEAITRSPAFLPGLLLAAGIALIFLPLWPRLFNLWQGEDGYYSHGFLVPAIAGYIVYRWWPRLQSIPVHAGWLALIPLALVLYTSRIAVANRIEGLMAVCLLGVLLLSIWLIAGWRWMWALLFPVAYLGFALPLWTGLINNTTNPLQIVSTKIAYYILKLMGFELYQAEPTVILMGSFELNVAVPCSGLKLVLALTAFTVFFMLIANLKWWGNVIMAAMILPLALLINGLRIAMIGVVGEKYGDSAGYQFHDYSGYITLIVCFFILFKLARFLGWKD